MIIAVFYYGGLLMNAQITVGELSSFMLYAAFTGVSIGGNVYSSQFDLNK
jgi:ATP-binding cassette subfamily B (MDR/TAP) protein 10